MVRYFQFFSRCLSVERARNERSSVSVGPCSEFHISRVIHQEAAGGSARWWWRRRAFIQSAQSYRKQGCASIVCPFAAVACRRIRHITTLPEASARSFKAFRKKKKRARFHSKHSNFPFTGRCPRRHAKPHDLAFVNKLLSPPPSSHLSLLLLFHAHALSLVGSSHEPGKCSEI